MSEFIDKFQLKTKQGSTQLALLGTRFLSGLLLALTLTIIAQEMIGFGQLSFFFLTVLITGLFIKLTGEWNFVRVLVFDFVCILIAVCIHMYILLAPG